LTAAHVVADANSIKVVTVQGSASACWPSNEVVIILAMRASVDGGKRGTVSPSWFSS
jgi:hypothetical protein